MVCILFYFLVFHFFKQAHEFSFQAIEQALQVFITLLLFLLQSF